jgi:long-chain acyl-CoA synthetase
VAGELLIKGPQVMKGYWKMPEETASVLRNGWLFTGDIARVDNKGRTFIVDRKKDMIINGGYNIYPEEIEKVIKEIPDIKDVAVVGIPDSYYGEIIKAYVVLKGDAQLDEAQLLAHCKKSLATYKVPRQFEFRRELPKTTTGKVLRRILMEEEKSRRGF